MCRHAFLTVTDHAFFPGTLATVNSVLEFHPDSEIFVVANHKHPLTGPQIECLRKSERVRLLDSREFDAAGRYLNAWELKAYACHDLCGDYDVIVGSIPTCCCAAASNHDSSVATPAALFWGDGTATGCTTTHRTHLWHFDAGRQPLLHEHVPLFLRRQ